MRTKPEPKENMLSVCFSDNSTIHTYFKTYGDFLRLRNDMFVVFLNHSFNNYSFDYYFAKLSKLVRSFLRNAKDYKEYMIRFYMPFSEDDSFIKSVVTFIETVEK